MKWQEIMNLERNQLMRASKLEIIEAIINERYSLKSKDEDIVNLRKHLESQSMGEKQACVILAGFLGIELKRSEYNQECERDQKHLNLLELIGLTMSKIMAMRKE